MKNIFIIVCICSVLIGHSQEATESPFKTPATYFMLGGGFAIVGSVTTIIPLTQPPPSLAAYDKVEDYSTAISNYYRTQKVCRIAGAACFGIAGIFFLVGGNDIAIIKRKNGSLTLNPNTNGMGLCYKFK